MKTNTLLLLSLLFLTSAYGQKIDVQVGGNYYFKGNHQIIKNQKGNLKSIYTNYYINDLLYVKAEDHYIRLFIADNKNHFVRGRLSDLETELPPNFIRIHRSYIINRNYVKSFSGDQIQLINGERLPIGRTYRKKIDH